MSAWYDEYLQTPHWQRLREVKLEAADYCCERCGEYARRGLGGAWTGLHVHHLNYERVGNERLDDLVVLCRACHEGEHGLAVADEETRERNRRELSRRITAKTTGWVPDDVEIEVAAWEKLAHDSENPPPAKGFPA